MTYAELQTLVAEYLQRTDLTSNIPAFINHAMHSLERRHNWEHMKILHQYDIVANDYLVDNTIPRFKELISASLIDSSGFRYKPLMKVMYEYATSKYPNFTSNIGRPLSISDVPAVEASLTTDAQPDEKWLLRPSSDASYTMEVFAYQSSPDLDGVTYTSNWWTENAPELLLFASLKEAEPFLMNDSRIALWDTRMKEELSSLRTSQENKKISGRYLTIGSRNPNFGSRRYDIDNDN